MSIDTQTPAELALAFEPSGYEQIPQKTVLTRLNYYDGKFLRADSLRLEQDYLRRLAELGARAGGAGLVYGFDVEVGSGELLTIGGGLGLDAAGRVLYLPSAFDVGLPDLVDRTRQAVPQAFASSGSAGFDICEPDSATTSTPPGTSGAEFFLITVAHAEDACGEEDVFGKLCDDGCATSTDRAYLVEGVIVRAVPFQPKTPFATSKAVSLTERHLRSQLASAAFEDERLAVPSRISKAGLLSGAWCTGAPRPTGWEVPIAIVGRLSSSTFADEWIVRRERIDVPPRRFWAWTMAMRPWESYLAQILQFQCQLPSALAGRGGDATSTDPCQVRIDALADAAKVFDELEVSFTGATEVPIGMAQFQKAHLQLKKVIAGAATPSQRILIDGGIVELPPAGYLPVTPGVEPTVQEQVRRLMGDGVDLRFCATTADFVAHALEEAQHMERISLLQGLDDPKNKPKVDVLVPDGAVGATPRRQALGWDARIGVSARVLGFRRANVALTDRVTTTAMLIARGTGRSDAASDGSFEFRFAGLQQQAVSTGRLVGTIVSNEAIRAGTIGGRGDATLSGATDAAAGDAAARPLIGAYGTVRCTRNPFELNAGDTFRLEGEGFAGEELSEAEFGATGTADGDFTVESRDPLAAGGQRVTASGTISAQGRTVGPSPDTASGSVDVELQLDLHTGTTPPTVEAHVRQAGDDRSDEFVLWAAWQGSPLEIHAAAGTDEDTEAGTTAAAGTTFPRPPIKQMLAAAELKRSDDVFTEGNPAHEAAQAGLETLASVFDDTRFTGEIEQELFDPDAGADDGGGTLTATRDWVLFHRRRIKDCDVAAPAPAPVATTRHLVMYADQNAFAGVLRELKRGSLPAALKLAKKVGDAEFDKDTANLRTPAATLKSQWVALSDGPPRAAGIAAVSVAADALLKDQAKAVALACGGNVLKPLTTFAVQGVPTGYDAVTFLRGTPKVADATYTVYATPNSDTLGILGRDLDLGRMLDDEGADLRLLGTAAFTSGTTTMTADNLEQLQQHLPTGSVFVGQVLVLERPSEPTQEDTDAQAREIVDAVGGKASSNGFSVETKQVTDVTGWPDTMRVCAMYVFGAE
jgi:hypothetical protein